MPHIKYIMDMNFLIFPPLICHQLSCEQISNPALTN